MNHCSTDIRQYSLRRVITALLLGMLLTTTAMADDEIGAERRSIERQHPTELIGAERTRTEVDSRPDSPWSDPPALVFYIFLIPILLSYAASFWKEWKRREARLQTAEEQHELREQHLHFVANISHEIRTPLTLISAPLRQLIEHNDLSPHDRDLLAIMQRNVTRLNHLAEQILNTSDHDRDDHVLHETFGDISQLVEGIAANFRFYAHEKGLRLTFDSQTEGKQGYFDMEKVEKIVSNLISNAIKYTPEQGEIVVRVRLDGRHVEVIVKDTGIGITGSKQREMFRRFNRLDVSVLNPGMKGFGVGLHYAQCLAFLHRGHLSYEPNVPQGSRFTLTIPYAEPVTAAVMESQHDEEQDDTSNTPLIEHPLQEIDETKPTILLTEDDYEMREYVRMLLEDDYNLIVATDGEEAIDKLTVTVPDLVLSDVVMRRMDGFELCTKVKASPDYGYLPVVLLTAKSDLDNRRHGIDCGADAYVSKPFDPYYLKSVIASVLANRQRIQQIIRNMTHIEPTVTTDASQDVIGNERDREFLSHFHNLLTEHLEDAELTVNVLASEMNMSYSSLYARVKDLTGQSPQVFLNTYRMNVAMELLRTHNYTVSEVCYKVGSTSPANFARSFKKQFGIVPSSV